MDELQIYHNQVPELNENVLIKFTKRHESHFEGNLLEYKYDAIMSYNVATKKKKIFSLNKILPLNKILIAKVEDVFENNIVQVSLAYNDNNLKDQLKPFNDTKILISLIKKLANQYNLSFNVFWQKIIHPIDKERKEENSNNLYEFFKENTILVNELIKKNYENYDEIINYINLNIITNNNKLKSKIGLISLNGIENIKNTIFKIVNEYKFNYSFKYDSTPYYILESNSIDSTIEDHNNFINSLNELAIKNKIFTKIEFIGKQ